MTLSREITRVLGGKWYGHYGLCMCPAHANIRTPALSVSDDRNGRLLLHCHAGCDFVSILTALKQIGAVKNVGNLGFDRTIASESVRSSQLDKTRKQENRAFECWNKALPVHGTIAETYLRNRGIICDIPNAIRFHPNCYHPSGCRYPAMIALVDNAQRVAVHRTYLRADGLGKSLVKPSKAMLGPVVGGAVRLSVGRKKLVVCEGIETGLSVLSNKFYRSASVWAALSTSGMKSLLLPSDHEHLVVATDGDEPGREAGNILAMRANLLGWKVSFLGAPEGKDWNDVLMLRRAMA